MMTRRLRSFLKSISKHLKFVQDEKYGYLSVNPANIGAALEVSIIARLPNLAKNYSKLKLLCENYDIVVRRQHQFFFELASTKKLGLSEFQIIVTFFNGVREIIEYERSLLQIILGLLFTLIQIYYVYCICISIQFNKCLIEL